MAAQSYWANFGDILLSDSTPGAVFLAAFEALSYIMDVIPLH